MTESPLPKVILIVDDNDDFRAIYRTILEREGYQVLTAAHGAEGVHLARRHLPHLILMDIQMPVMDGAHAAWYLKHDVETKQIPICAISALFSEETVRQQPHAENFDCFLPKPSDPQKVVRTISALIGPPRRTVRTSLSLREDEAIRAAWIERTIANLLEFAMTQGDLQRHRQVPLPEGVRQATRHLRQLAKAVGVEIRIAQPLPRVEVIAPVVELVVMTYLANAITYYNRSTPQRWAEIRARLDARPDPLTRDVILAVADNGLAVEAAVRQRLFSRYARTDPEMRYDIAGTGLGLALVRETVEGVGGRVWADLDNPAEIVFACALPAGRTIEPVKRRRPSQDPTPPVEL